MATVNMETPVSTDTLLSAVGQLSTDEMAEFAFRVRALRAHRLVPSLPDADLIEEISRPLPEETRRRYAELIERRDNDRLATSEHQEFLMLTEEAEAFDVRRLNLLAELAERRGVPLRDLMRSLGAVESGNV